MSNEKYPVVVEPKGESRVYYVRSGEAWHNNRGRLGGFSGLKLTRSRRWAKKFTADEACEAASAINIALDTGFYPSLKIEFARESRKAFA